MPSTSWNKKDTEYLRKAMAAGKLDYAATHATNLASLPFLANKFNVAKFSPVFNKLKGEFGIALKNAKKGWLIVAFYRFSSWSKVGCCIFLIIFVNCRLFCI